MREAIARFGRRAGKVMNHPTMRLCVGMSLVLTGIDDIADELFGEDVFLPLHLFHGAVVFGLAHAFTALFDICEGLAVADEDEPAEADATPAT